MVISRKFIDLDRIPYDLAVKVAKEPFPKNYGYMYRDGEDTFLFKHVDIPCGHCLECRQAYKRVWAYRCMLEAEHSNNCWFVTLTYDDLHNDGSLHKKHWQDFMKRLRSIVGPGVRFFSCGEYGTHTHRPHYHALLFNCPMTECMFATQELQKAWTLGFVQADPVVNMQTCAYVAGYTSKKLVNFKPRPDQETPFVLMSRRPGIGERWIRDHLHEIQETDRLYFAFSDETLSVKPFRYCDKLAEKEGIELLDTKLKREIGMFYSHEAEKIMRKTDDKGVRKARLVISQEKERRRNERNL